MRRTAISLAISSALVAAPTAALAAEKAPYLKPDGSWITLSGTVTSTADETFKLDYGGGLVTVEMDDWDWYDEDSGILSGDKVTVYGEVDDDTFENTKIEASSVYVENLGTYFFASATDEENFTDLDVAPTVPIDVGDLTITGTVQSVNGREFTIDSALQQMKVDTTLMPYNPMDNEGYQQIDKGDLVTVTGNTEYDTFEKQELMAESVVTLDDDSDSSS